MARLAAGRLAVALVAVVLCAAGLADAWFHEPPTGGLRVRNGVRETQKAVFFSLYVRGTFVWAACRCSAFFFFFFFFFFFVAVVGCCVAVNEDSQHISPTPIPRAFGFGPQIQASCYNDTSNHGENVCAGWGTPQSITTNFNNDGDLDFYVTSIPPVSSVRSQLLFSLWRRACFSCPHCLRHLLWPCHPPLCSSVQSKHADQLPATDAPVQALFFDSIVPGNDGG